MRWRPSGCLPAAARLAPFVAARSAAPRQGMWMQRQDTLWQVGDTAGPEFRRASLRPKSAKCASRHIGNVLRRRGSHKLGQSEIQNRIASLRRAETQSRRCPTAGNDRPPQLQQKFLINGTNLRQAVFPHVFDVVIPGPP
jgi:hypothetical protein